MAQSKLGLNLFALNSYVNYVFLFHSGFSFSRIQIMQNDCIIEYIFTLINFDITNLGRLSITKVQVHPLLPPVGLHGWLCVCVCVEHSKYDLLI